MSAGQRRAFLVRLGNAGGFLAACRDLGVAPGLMIAERARTPEFAADWDEVSAARRVLAETLMLDRVLAGFAADDGADLPDKTLVALGQWLVGERGARTAPAPKVGRAGRAGRPEGDAAADPDAIDDAARVAALVAEVRARLEAREGEPPEG